MNRSCRRTFSDPGPHSRTRAHSGGLYEAGRFILDVMVVRGILALPLSHVVDTAIAGAGVGYVVSRPGQPVAGRILGAAVLFATACLLDGFQNSPILDDVSGSPFIKGLAPVSD